MNYKGTEVPLILKGNEVDVLDYLMLSGLSAVKKEDYAETMACLHDIRTQITDVLEKEMRELSSLNNQKEDLLKSFLDNHKDTSLRWFIERAFKAEKYEKALEYYAYDAASLTDDGSVARKALEEE